MKIRQYERGDCNEAAHLGLSYEISTSRLTANGGGETDLVSVFRNPKTKRRVWVPYGSQILIKKESFIVERGELKEELGNRFHYGDVHDQIIKCLIDGESNAHSMEDLIGQLVSIESLNNSFWARRKHFSFDLEHNKIQSEETKRAKWKEYNSLR